ncbi:MAG: hypothetical protein QGH45_12060, partial [Myxococcota bacterium]|nr:hypothetical protein [Myxococcota bacterium]
MRWQLVLLGTVGLLALAVGCPGEDDDDSAGPGDDDDAPLGMILANDGVTYAGAASIDVTPDVVETWTDHNGDGTFDGCLDDPDATGEYCSEPFDDVDGDGWFDAIFIGGYGPMRPANGVHDPITVRAVVLSHDGEYLALVGMDLVG